MASKVEESPLEMMLSKALRSGRGGRARRVICAGMALVCALLCALTTGNSLLAQDLKAKSKVQDLKKAQREVQQGEKAEAAGHLDAALALYNEAAKDAPMDLGIVGHASALRAKLVQTHVNAAENAAIHGDLRRAADELRTALKIDPGNAIVAERETQMRSMKEEELPEGPPEEYKLKGPPQLRPKSGVQDFNLRGDTRGAYERMARAFGITVAFDPDMVSRNVTLNITGADFETTIRILGQQTTTFYRVLTPDMIFVAADTIEKRKQYGMEVEETFMLGAVVDAQDMTDLLRALREITSATHIQLDVKSHTITIRDSAEKVKLAGMLIKQVERAHSELMLDIALLEVDKNKAIDLGLTPPTGAKAFALSSNDVKILAQATDFANLVTLLQQVFAAQGITSVPPVIPVGGGKSTYLLNLPGTTANFSDALSLVRTGREVLMRVQDTKPATLFIGQRFPVTLSLLSTSLGGTTVTGAIPSTIFPRTDFNVGQTPIALTSKDFDGDGRADIAVANQTDNTISILLGQGDGTFTQPNNPIALGTNETGPSAIASGVFRLTDANHLTQPADLVIANQNSNTVTVLLGNGDGTFAEASGSPFTVGAQPRSVVIADFNGDGNLDFAVADSGDNTIATFQGNGDGTFTAFPKSPFALPTGMQAPVAMVTGNFRNLSTSGADIAIVNQITNNVAILEATGDNTFDGTFTIANGSPFAVGTGPIAIAAGDLNSDGVPDLAVVNATDSTISVFINNGDATFAVSPSSPLTTSSGANPSGVVIADFTNDGIGDIAVTNAGVSTLGIYIGLGLGAFASQIELSTPSGPQALITADFDGNGLPDAALTAHSGTLNQVSVFLDPSTFASGGSVQVPYPGSEYIDLGLKIKATPYVHGEDEVTLQLDFEIRALAGSAINGIPVINNQTLSQTVRLKQDQTSIIGGMTDREATNLLASLPGLGEIPGLSYAVQNRNNTSTETEFLILVTPRRLRIPPRKSASIYAGPTPGAGANAPAPVQPTPEPEPPPQPTVPPENPNPQPQ